MPKPGAAPRQYRCSLCGETVETIGALSQHRASVHPMRGVSDPPQSPRAITSRGSAGAAPAYVSRETPRGPRRIEDVTGAPRPDAALPPAAEDSGGGAPASPEPTGGRLRPSRPQLAQPVIRLSSEMRTEGVRDAIRDALPMATLADLLHAVSVAVSEADGAGEAGYLSPIQCTQVAFLLYDSTIDLVVSRFDGNVGRFKAAMAVTLILVSKGSIHARAIGVKLDARRRAAPARVPLPAPETEPESNGHVPGLPGIPVAPAPEFADTYAEAAQRQAGLMAQGVVS